MKMFMKTYLFVCFAVLFAGAALSQELSVPLTVREPAGVERKAEPVSGGIPLPEGMFKKGQPFALSDGAKEIPIQVSPLVVDNDGYLRWILLDTQVDLKAGETKTLMLKAAKPTSKPTAALKLADGARGVMIETGKITLALPRTVPFGLAVVRTPGEQLVTPGSVASYVDAFDG